MKIATTEEGQRTHRVAGKDWTFMPTEGGPSVCNVTDQAAQLVFLDQRNANLFTALEPVTPLKRGTEPQKPADPPKEDTKPLDPTAVEADAKGLVGLSVRQLRTTLAQVPFPAAVLTRALELENAAEPPRAAVLTALQAAIDA